MQSRGLGDEMAKLFAVTGVKAVVKSAVNAISLAVKKDLDCGCEKRQEDLNKLVPFNTQRNEHN